MRAGAYDYLLYATDVIPVLLYILSKCVQYYPVCRMSAIDINDV